MKSPDEPILPSLRRRQFLGRMACVALAAAGGPAGANRPRGGFAMMDKLTCADFEGRLGELFNLRPEGAPCVPLRLVEAARGGQPNRAGLREPFSLVFEATDLTHLPQRIYRLEHAAAGELEIFLVPIGPRDGRMRYQAVFG